MSLSTHPSSNDRHELRFASLFNAGRGYSFPCDACGRVDLDTLSDGERHRYLYAARDRRPRAHDADRAAQRALNAGGTRR